MLLGWGPHLDCQVVKSIPLKLSPHCGSEPTARAGLLNGLGGGERRALGMGAQVGPDVGLQGESSAAVKMVSGIPEKRIQRRYLWGNFQKQHLSWGQCDVVKHIWVLKLFIHPSAHPSTHAFKFAFIYAIAMCQNCSRSPSGSVLWQTILFL